MAEPADTPLEEAWSTISRLNSELNEERRQSARSKSALTIVLVLVLWIGYGMVQTKNAALDDLRKDVAATSQQLTDLQHQIDHTKTVADNTHALMCHRLMRRFTPDERILLVLNPFFCTVEELAVS